MCYRVLNMTTRELIAELHEREIAIGIAHQLAHDHDYKERFGVVELRVICETPLRNEEDDNSN